jgi:hypothetical protein
LEEFAELVAAGIDPLEIVEIFARGSECAEWPRNVTTEEEQEHD